MCEGGYITTCRSVIRRRSRRCQTREIPTVGSLPRRQQVSRASLRHPREKTAPPIRLRGGQPKGAFSRLLDRFARDFPLKMFAGSLTGMLSENEPGDIAGRIGEQGQLRTARHFGWGQDRLAAELFHAIQCCLQILHLGINRNALSALVGG